MKKESPNSKIAVIDCGTNTFKLLIVKIEKNHWVPIYQSILEVKLTSGNTFRGLAPERMARGIDVLRTFQENIVNFEVDRTIALATSAIRSAVNGEDYLVMIKQKTGIDVQVIDGDREAALIFKGVKQSVEFTDKPFLIMDIGGGSTEFIIADHDGILWKKSFPLGSSRLNNKFRPEAPMTNENKLELEQYFEENLTELFEMIQKYRPEVLLGNSGAFDSLVSIIKHNFKDITINEKNNVIPMVVFDEIHEKLCQKTLEEKLLVQGLVPMRAEIITLATLLTKFVLTKSGIQKLIQTPFALKEGVVGELLEQ